MCVVQMKEEANKVALGGNKVAAQELGAEVSSHPQPERKESTHTQTMGDVRGSDEGGGKQGGSRGNWIAAQDLGADHESWYG
jgi:hypothetical protein